MKKQYYTKELISIPHLLRCIQTLEDSISDWNCLISQLIYKRNKGGFTQWKSGRWLCRTVPWFWVDLSIYQINGLVSIYEMHWWSLWCFSLFCSLTVCSSTLSHQPLTTACLTLVRISGRRWMYIAKACSSCQKHFLENLLFLIYQEDGILHFRRWRTWDPQLHTEMKAQPQPGI